MQDDDTSTTDMSVCLACGNAHAEIEGAESSGPITLPPHKDPVATQIGYSLDLQEKLQVAISPHLRLVISRQVGMRASRG